jgi:hypothetical protein
MTKANSYSKMEPFVTICCRLFSMQGFAVAEAGGAGELRSGLESRASPDLREDNIPTQASGAPPQVYPTYRLLGNLPSSPPQGQVLEAAYPEVRRPSRPGPTTAASDTPSRMPERQLPAAYSDEPIKVGIQQQVVGVGVE